MTTASTVQCSRVQSKEGVLTFPIFEPKLELHSEIISHGNHVLITPSGEVNNDDSMFGQARRNSPDGCDGVGALQGGYNAFDLRQELDRLNSFIVGG